MAREKVKTDSIGIRIPPRTRYALDLIARKRGTSLSALMVEAADKLIASEGMTVVRPGDKATLLDTLWSESEGERLIALLNHAPSLLTHPERVMALTLSEIRKVRYILEDNPDLLDINGSRISHSDGIAHMICLNNLDRDLLATGISDTFADEYLAAGGEFENTKALKDAVREMREKLGPTADRENP